MAAAEELFDMSGDRLELTNEVANENVLSDLNAIRKVYDQSVYDIGEKGIRKEYRDYQTIFDRKKLWEQEVLIL